LVCCAPGTPSGLHSFPTRRSSDLDGLTQSKPFKKMGIGSSPTGELFLSNVHCGPERLLGGSEDSYGRSGAKGTFMQERAGVAARSEEHTSELQSRENLVCRLLLEK